MSVVTIAMLLCCRY